MHESLGSQTDRDAVIFIKLSMLMEFQRTRRINSNCECHRAIKPKKAVISKHDTALAYDFRQGKENSRLLL